MELTPVIPFEPIRTNLFPVGPPWIAQVKWDGVRMLTYYDGHEVKLINRKRNDRTLQYPEFTQADVYSSASSFILDGELIAFREGKPSFHEIMRRDSLRSERSIRQGLKSVPVTYMVFDILYLNGVWVTDRPLSERQQLLAEMIKPHPQVQLVQNFPDGNALFEAVKAQQLEGVVVKDLNSTYAMDGKDNRWQKRKKNGDLYAVIGGVTFRDKLVNSLLLGLYNEQGELEYIGHAGTGRFTVQDWRTLTEQALSMGVKHMPFVNIPGRNQGALWIQPELVVRVTFLEWTPGGTMRHPTIESFAPHIPAAECRVAQKEEN
ncbi:RNA ligase family protein [Paenibacillus provencensis]|uniref:DNA ligase (ATP) n=1 Tax=Paenibacillus provencensis TaxID=441151 RepID=A0ABW3Q8T8_9BACL|nr:RNA ligase family protein [Paenibacillus sp. MER 78]MCM3127695.1 DNA ligase [Paenibacillus sp. MER 78]